MAYRVDDVDPEAWHELLTRFPDRTVFHSLAWLSILRDAHRLSLVLLKVEDESDVCAVWPCLQLRKGPFHVLGSPLPGWSTAYMGPLFAQQADVREVLEAFMRYRRLRRCSYFACRTLDRRRPVDMTHVGFRRLRRFETYLLDLGVTEEALWSSLESRCRNSIRKARKTGVEIRAEETPSFLDDFWIMAEEVFRESNIRPNFSRRFLDELWGALGSTGHLLALSAFHGGQRIACAVLPFDHQTMYYWGGAFLREFRTMAPNNLLQWEAILAARQLGLSCYDFVSSKGTGGRFKKSFGPKPVELATHWERASNRLTGMLKTFYERHLRRRRTLDRRQ